MVELCELTNCFNVLLNPQHCSERAYNGLQVESRERAIRKAAFAVDAGLSVITKAIENHAQLLVVHHGLLWGASQAIVGPLGDKVSNLLIGGCSLYASHLPLDGNRQIGNAVEVARFCGLENIEGFFEYEGITIGAKARTPKARDLSFFYDRVKSAPGAIEPLVLPFGSSSIHSVGILTGSGSSALELCKAEGLDLLISGEAKHEAYHLARELEINAIFMGHYASETFGVRALMKIVQDKFDVETAFIDEPTGT